MRHLSAVLSIFSIFVLFSCATTNQIEPTPLQIEDIDSWLEAVSSEGSAAINVEGKWVDPDSRRWNWGKGNLWQKENKISGFIGIYNVRGIVSEKIAYLVFYSEGVVHYTAKLEMVEIGVLEGQYFEATDVEQKTGSFLRFIAKMN